MKQTTRSIIRKTMLILLCVSMVLTLFSGCGSDEDEWIESEIVITEEDGENDTDDAQNDNQSGGASAATSAGKTSKSGNGSASNGSANKNSPPDKLKNPNVTFFWPATIPDHPELTEICKAFEKKYGGKVTIVGDGDWDGRGSRLTNLVQSKTQVDVVFTCWEDYPSYAKTKVTRPMDKNQFDFTKAPFQGADKSTLAYFNGELYNITEMSDDISGRVTVYNKTMFEENGLETPLELYKKGKWDWNAFRNAARELTVDQNGDGTADVYGFAEYDINGLACSNGTALLQYDGKKYFFDANNKKLREAYQLFHDMINVDKSIHPDIWGWQSAMEKGTLAMVFNAYGLIESMKKNGAKYDYDFAPLPKGTSASCYYTNGVEGDSFALGATCKNPEGAYAFIKFYLSYQPKSSSYKYSDAQLKLAKEISGFKFNPYSPTGFGSLKMDARTLFFEIRYGNPVGSVIEEYGPTLKQDVELALK